VTRDRGGAVHRSDVSWFRKIGGSLVLTSRNPQGCHLALPVFVLRTAGALTNSPATTGPYPGRVTPTGIGSCLSEPSTTAMRDLDSLTVAGLACWGRDTEPGTDLALPSGAGPPAGMRPCSPCAGRSHEAGAEAGGSRPMGPLTPHGA
jgi:hypothetical protein